MMIGSVIFTYILIAVFYGMIFDWFGSGIVPQWQLYGLAAFWPVLLLSFIGVSIIHALERTRKNND